MRHTPLLSTCATALLLTASALTAAAQTSAPQPATAPRPLAAPTLSAAPRPPTAPAPPATGSASAGPVHAPEAAPSAEARDTKRALRQVLGQYPPSVGEVFGLDPSLLSSAGYLESYPALAVFLVAHPEVVRNPGFYFPRRSDGPDDVSAILAVSAGALGMMFLFITLVRAALQHRRWQQGLRVQQDMQARLTERLLAREDLATYLDTPSGRRLFETIRIEADPQSTATAAGRILRSVQTGIVLTFFGASVVMLQGRLSQALGEQVATAGTVAVMVGLGFLVSAAASHVLSRRLGLLASQDSRD